MNVHNQVCGATIALNRHFRFVCFPAEEAGPAAIIFNWRENYAEQIKAAGWIARGEASRFDHQSAAIIGARHRESQSVAIVAPGRPGASEFNMVTEIYGFDGEPVWKDAETWRPSECEEDVTLVWLPRKIFPRQTIAETAARLVDAAFGGGAVYNSESLAQLYEQKRQQLKQSRASGEERRGAR